MLAQYAALFGSHRASFSGPPPDGLTFQDQGSDDPDAPRMLDPKGSISFILHQQTTEKILELVDAIQSHGSERIRDVRRSLVQEIQTHQAYLDQLVQREWPRWRLKHTQIPRELEGKMPRIVQPGTVYGLFFCRSF